MQPSLRCTRGLAGPDRLARATEMYHRSQLLPALAVSLVFQTSVATAGDRSGQSENRFVIKTLSGDADRVSGGDALVEITLPPRERTVTVTLNGSNITDEFRPGQSPNSLVGLVNHVPLRVGLSFGPAPTQGHEHDDENDD